MNKRILIMDDSPIFLDVARVVFEEAGFEVMCATNLAELQHARKSSPRFDLILVDVQMPEAFGDDVAMTLRFAHEIPTPIYLLSSLAPHELAERVTEAKIDGFISKSNGMEVILDEVRQILN